VPENGGMFVCKSRLVSMTGSGQITASTVATQEFCLVPMSPRVMAPPLRAGFGDAKFSSSSSPTPRNAGLRTHDFGNNRGRRDDAMIGKTVQIFQGPFKG
jgi:transcription elongation factor